jgi:hypothetical protein
MSMKLCCSPLSITLIIVSSFIGKYHMYVANVIYSLQTWSTITVFCWCIRLLQYRPSTIWKNGVIRFWGSKTIPTFRSSSLETKQVFSLRLIKSSFRLFDGELSNKQQHQYQ